MIDPHPAGEFFDGQTPEKQRRSGNRFEQREKGYHHAADEHKNAHQERWKTPNSGMNIWWMITAARIAPNRVCRSKNEFVVFRSLNPDAEPVGQIQRNVPAQVGHVPIAEGRTGRNGAGMENLQLKTHKQLGNFMVTNMKKDMGQTYFCRLRNDPKMQPL